MIEAFLRWDERVSQSAPFLFGVFGILILSFWLFYLMCPPDVNLFTDDAYSYIECRASRTILYPLILYAVKLFTGSYSAVSFVQLTTLCASTLVMAVSFSRFLKSFLLGVVLACAILSLSEIVKFCFEIYTESLCVSLLLLLAANCLFYIKSRSERILILIGLIVGLLILLRPSSYAILGSILFLFLPVISKKEAIFKFFIPPVTMCLLIGAGANYVRHGLFSTQSFMGHNLFGKTAFVVTEKTHSNNVVESKVMQKMASNMAPIQAEIDKVNDIKFYYILSAPLHDKLRFFVLDKKIKPNITELSACPDLDSFYKNVSLKAIVQNPVAYVKDVIIHYGALWFVWDIITPSEKGLLIKWINYLKSTDAFNQVDQDYSQYKFREKGFISFLLIKGFLYFCFCLSFVFMIRAAGCLFEKKPLQSAWKAGLFLSTSIHSIYFFTACFQAGYPRYSMLMWPYMFMMFLTFIGIFLDYFKMSMMRKEPEPNLVF